MKKTIPVKHISLFVLALTLSQCGLISEATEAVDDDDYSQQTLCAALGVTTLDEFEAADFSTTFSQTSNDNTIFISTSSNVEEDFDGENVITLDSAVVAFDYEDTSVDGSELGGFNSRWKIILVPQDDTLESAIDDALGGSATAQNELVGDMRDNENSIEVQLSGPFESNGCEWGDTDEIGTQTLTYSDYGIYDWDYFSGVTEVVGIIYEGDDELHDDLIAKISISQDEGEVTVSDSSGNSFDFTSFTSVE